MVRIFEALAQLERRVKDIVSANGFRDPFLHRRDDLVRSYDFEDQNLLQAVELAVFERHRVRLGLQRVEVFFEFITIQEEVLFKAYTLFLEHREDFYFRCYQYI